MKPNIFLDSITVEFVLDQKKLTVIRDLSLELDATKITVVLGKSGCGKTTLLRSVKQLIPVSSGKIHNHTNQLAMVFQQPRLMPWLNVEENIQFGLAHPLLGHELENLISLVKLSGFEKAYPSQLSGGMQSRVALLRALAIHPDYLLLDEPFAALDEITRFNLQQELLTICKQRQVGALFVTHSIDEAIILADTILIMEAGKIKQRFELPSPPHDILDHHYIELKKTLLESLREIQ